MSDCFWSGLWCFDPDGTGEISWSLVLNEFNILERNQRVRRLKIPVGNQRSCFVWRKLLRCWIQHLRCHPSRWRYPCGGGQNTPTTLCLSACLLNASPRLTKLIYKFQNMYSEDTFGGIYSVLKRRYGHIFEESYIADTPILIIKAYLLVNESFGFTIHSSI